MILIDQTTPAGQRLVLESQQELSGRGRVTQARLVVRRDDEVLWEGPDTPATGPEWKAVLEQALSPTDAPAATTGRPRGRKRGTDGH